MPKFAANLSMMFNEVPFLDRFALAAQAASFKGVEYLFPYDYPVQGDATRLESNALQTCCSICRRAIGLPVNGD
jgi:hydroxypyruvate isomerase